jgi:poly-gamma-glutamate synthesis protein (capsule biosynthesis protein)
MMNSLNEMNTGAPNIRDIVCYLLMLAMVCGSRAQAQDPWPWSPVADGSVTLLLLGDFNVQKRADPADALVHVRETLQEADVVYANLEGLLVPSQGADRDLPNKTGWTHLGPESVQALLAGNLAAVGVANNVAYGRANILASLSVLDAHGIAHAGAGDNIEQAHRPAIVTRGGVTFGFLQYTSKWYDEAEQMATVGAPGVARLKSPDGETLDPGDQQRMLEDIQRTRPRVDILIVSTHTRDGQGRGGTAPRAPRSGDAAGADDLYSLLPVNESLEEVEPYQRKLARLAIDAGADLVYGHGCHMLQAVEVYRGRPVLHCLGNFASDWIRVRNYRDGLVARVVVQDKKVKRVSLAPVTRDPESNNVRLIARESEAGTRLYTKIRELSQSTPLTVRRHELVLMDN